MRQLSAEYLSRRGVIATGIARRIIADVEFNETEYVINNYPQFSEDEQQDLQDIAYFIATAIDATKRNKENN